ncbi:hypothetical protein APHAL10511_003060 [Amanita phalloides]|nr:hypothetical protein APHAL10511_003060 [Amanita phalloides]
MDNKTISWCKDSKSEVQAVESPDPELALPNIPSLAIIIIVSTVLQLSFFIIIPASDEYALYLGGDSTFSGLTIGIPTAISGLILFPLTKYDRGRYRFPLHLSCAACILGHILYSLAFNTRCLYLLLIGRIVNGFAFAFWMYCKRYCSDPRIVGIRRRTTLAGFLVVGQGLGTSAGPFFGGLLYKTGLKNPIFNGFTSPGWIMAGIWCILWICVTLWFEDVPPVPSQLGVSYPVLGKINREGNSNSNAPPSMPGSFSFSRRQTGAMICMCWFGMTCFFILGAWEANIPVFGAAFGPFHWSPYAAGNFIALGAAIAFPFLVTNIFVARCIEDRKILAFGFSLGLAGLFIFLALLETDKLNYGSMLVCWWAVALGFNVVSSMPISLLSKKLPSSWNNRISLMVQCCMYAGRVGGAIWGGSGVRIGMRTYVVLEIALVGIGIILYLISWHDLETKLG